MTTSQKLLAEYIESCSESAFRELVNRHIELVHSAALRLAGGDRHLAQDVSQMAFMDLARKAKSLPRDVLLAGWLHRHTCFVASRVVRGERRRQERERKAAEMNAPGERGEIDFSRLSPILDEVINELPEPDRVAILLRFFEKLEFRKIGELTASTEDAARMRVNRALEKMEPLLKRRGITSTAAALSVTISAGALQGVPAGLATVISTTAASACSTTTAAGVSTLSKIITMTTFQKTVLAATIAILAGTLVHEVHRDGKLRAQVRALQQQQAPMTGKVRQLQSQLDEATDRAAAMSAEIASSKSNAAELAKLRNEVTVLSQTRAAPPVAAFSAPSQSEVSQENQPPLEDVGRGLGLAVVRGDSTAFGKIADMAKVEHKDFNAKLVGLNDTQRGDLGRQIFAPLQSAFAIISDAAANGNSSAMDALAKAFQIPELKGMAVQSLGMLAGKGNADALNVLLSPDESGVLLSSAVAALKPAANNGNDRAIEALAAVASDTTKQPLWFMAADGLNKAAESGNSVAIDALIHLLAVTNQSVRGAAITGLRLAAANQKARAAEGLRAAGIP